MRTLAKLPDLSGNGEAASYAQIGLQLQHSPDGHEPESSSTCLLGTQYQFYFDGRSGDVFTGRTRLSSMNECAIRSVLAMEVSFSGSCK
jgi:hypothetical protein